MDTGIDEAGQHYDLRGWRMHFVFNVEKLNALLLRYYESRPDSANNDALDFVHQRPSGWLRICCVLGSPLLEFPTGNGDSINVTRRFVSYTSYEFQRASGANQAELFEVVAGSRNERMALFQTFKLDQCVGTYKYNDNAVFTLTEGSDFSVGLLGGQGRDTEAGLPFKIRFANLPAGEKNVVLPKTADVSYGRWLMQDLRFHLRSVEGQLVMYIASSDEANGSFPGSRNTGRDEVSVTDESLLGQCYLDVRNIPEAGYYGLDFEHFAQILFPRGYVKFAGMIWGGPGNTVAEARLVDLQVKGADAFATENAAYSSHVNPLVRIVPAGSVGQRLVLNTVNLGTPVWQFASETIGQLVPDGRTCTYVPQGDGDVIYGESPLTRKDAALHTSLKRNPVDIVRIITGFTLLPYYSTIVVLNAKPTHYFKLAIVGGKLQMTFCYEPWGGGETVVAPELTDWKVLAGDGKVSDGIFTPGVINRFSVVQAIHRDPIYMQFAVIIIPVPMLTAAEFVAMRNGG